MNITYTNKNGQPVTIAIPPKIVMEDVEAFVFEAAGGPVEWKFDTGADRMIAAIEAIAAGGKKHPLQSEIYLSLVDHIKSLGYHFDLVWEQNGFRFGLILFGGESTCGIMVYDLEKYVESGWMVKSNDLEALKNCINTIHFCNQQIAE